MPPTAHICHRELERSRLTQVAGAGRTLGNDATAMSRQDGHSLTPYKHLRQPMNVLGEPALGQA